MKESRQNSVGKIIAAIFTILLLVLMGIVLAAGTSIEAAPKDNVIYALEVIWTFLIPSLACLLKWNPKNAFSKLKFAYRKGMKGVLTYWAVVLLIWSAGIAAIDHQHSEEYHTIVQSHNEQMQPDMP